ncbi:MAG: arsenite methyltransferase [Nitrospiraceae bacterium]
MESSDIKQFVREKYGEAAKRATSGGSSCCGAAPALGNVDPITMNLYSDGEAAALPADAVAASLGCGNPTALAELKPGETVLDLGSGGGIDVLLSARRVGPTGKAYGLDMTDEMLALARKNQQAAGLTNVEFLKGEIEQIPLPNASVDVVISNCVVNLSGDKPAVIREIFRVLKPGGRVAVSDVVVNGEVPPAIRRSMELWAGCVAGALDKAQFQALLEQAGFDAVDIEPTRIYTAKDVEAFMEGTELAGTATHVAAQVEGKIMSAFVRATKPALVEQSCCGGCC